MWTLHQNKNGAKKHEIKSAINNETNQKNKEEKTTTDEPKKVKYRFLC